MCMHVWEVEAHARCEAAATHCMHEGRLLRDRSMSSFAGVEGATVPRDADYRLFLGGDMT